ncbi:MAG: hypothetical protein DCO96_07840 [Fluviicola sp. XM-24bin1]|nr:MAG: hypothetical protein DCO96_07840 [Fluviicola sp. XM-24bin1]
MNAYSNFTNYHGEPNPLPENVQYFYHDLIGPIISGLKLMIHNDLISEGNGEIGLKYISVLNELQRKLQEGIEFNDDSTGLEKKIQDLMTFFPHVDFRSCIKISAKIGEYLSSNLLLLISEIINNLVKHDRIKVLDLKIKIVEERIELQFKHDCKGLSQSRFDVLSKSSNKTLGIQSISNRLSKLNLEIIYRTGVIEVYSSRSKPSREEGI